ncbi:hypothetical protein LINPERPRIM_LOCUS4831, partial [Linum perenne]
SLNLFSARKRLSAFILSKKSSRVIALFVEFADHLRLHHNYALFNRKMSGFEIPSGLTTNQGGTNQVLHASAPAEKP